MTKSPSDEKTRFSVFQKVKGGFSLDYTSLGVFRILLGLTLLLDLGIRSVDLTAHYTDYGVLSRVAVIQAFEQTTNFSIHLATGTAAGQALIFLLHGVILLAFVFGYRTRVSTVLAWFFAISLQSRNELVLNGGDHYLRIILFWAMFLPLGERLGVDAKNRKATPASDYFSISSIVFIFQIAAVYWFAALLKTGPEWTKDFTALQYALNISFFSMPFGRWLLHFPVMLSYVTRVTLLMEYSLPFFLFHSRRKLIFQIRGYYHPRRVSFGNRSRSFLGLVPGRVFIAARQPIAFRLLECRLPKEVLRRHGSYWRRLPSGRE